MSKLNKIEGTTLRSINVTEKGKTHSLFFDEQGNVHLMKEMYGNFVLPHEPVDVLGIVRSAAPTPDMVAEFTTTLGREIEYLGYCLGGCAYPWNVEPNAVRCGHCGEPIIGMTDWQYIWENGGSYSLDQYKWDVMARALRLANENKIEAFLTRSPNGESYRLALGWKNRNLLASGKTTFRGKVNLSYFEDYNVDWWPEPIGDGEGGEVCGFILMNANNGLNNFIDDHGAKLVENPLVSLNPEREAKLREAYIHKAFIGGKFYTQSGETMRPYQRFIKRLYGSISLGELATESAWEIYNKGLEMADTKSIVHKDGTISWRFEAAIEAIKAADGWLADFLVERYNADEDEVAELRPQVDEEE